MAKEKVSIENIKKLIKNLNPKYKYVSKKYKKIKNRSRLIITIQCNNNHIFNVEYENLKKRKFLKCPICGERKCTYKYDINDIIETKYGNLLVIDRYYTLKNNRIYNRRYKYKCLNDGYIGDISEDKIKLGRGCPVCSNQKIIKGINDIATTHPHLVKYFANIEDAYINTYGTSKKIKIKCPICGKVQKREKRIYDLIRGGGFNCEYCSDGFSIPEKFMYNILQQLNIDFVFQFSESWSERKLYDFYFELDNKMYIIETHGLQHYEHTGFKRSVEEEQENDKFKKELALQNGIKEENYIIIDCRESNLEWIRDNDNGILHSRLNELFDLSNIDWLQALEYSVSNFIKIACEIYNNTNNTKMVSQKLKLSLSCVLHYLKIGNELGWCEYNSSESLSLNGKRAGEMRRKKVICITTGDIFESASKAEEIWGINHSNISACCNKNYTYAGKHPVTNEKLIWEFLE